MSLFIYSFFVISVLLTVIYAYRRQERDKFISKNLKQRRYTSLSLLFIEFLVFPFICCLLTTFPRNYRHLEYIRAFGEIKHPTNTKLISRHNLIGRLHPLEDLNQSENYPFEHAFDPTRGCNHLIGEVRDYSGTMKTVKAFYAAQIITISGREIPIEYFFFQADPSGMPPMSEVSLGVDYFLHGAYVFRPPLDASKSYYFVYLLRWQSPC